MKNSNYSKPVVQYSSLSNVGFDHFEVAILAIYEANKIIRSAEYIPSNDNDSSNLKPKVAVVALKTLCDEPEKAVMNKEEIISNILHSDSNEDEHDDYNVDDLDENTGDDE